jgi:osmotically-inducible protein OsmY
MRKNEIPDRTLLQKVNQRLGRMGSGSQTRVTATVCRGEVTLSGTIQYAMQRNPLVSAVTSVAGIRRVIDRLQEPPQKKKWE